MACRSINLYSSLAGPRRAIADQSPVIGCWQHEAGRFSVHRSIGLCCAAPESSSAATVADKKDAEPAKATAAAEPAAKEGTDKKESEPATAAAAPAKPKKAPVKPLPQMMEEDVIPSLKANLEAQEDLLQIELSFKDNRLEGSFLKNGIPYNFWAFFPDGVLTGASTVEPFLIDERKITDKHIVFWVEKRLAAQGILPVWKE